MFSEQERKTLAIETRQFLLTPTATLVAQISTEAERRYPDDKAKQAALIGATVQMALSLITAGAVHMGGAPIEKLPRVMEKWRDAVNTGVAMALEAKAKGKASGPDNEAQRGEQHD